MSNKLKENANFNLLCSIAAGGESLQEFGLITSITDKLEINIYVPGDWLPHNPLIQITSIAQAIKQYLLKFVPSHIDVKIVIARSRCIGAQHKILSGLIDIQFTDNKTNKPTDLLSLIVAVNL